MEVLLDLNPLPKLFKNSDHSERSSIITPFMRLFGYGFLDRILYVFIIKLIISFFHHEISYKRTYKSEENEVLLEVSKFLPPYHLLTLIPTPHSVML